MLHIQIDWSTNVNREGEISIEQLDIKIAFSMEFLIIWEWKL